MSSRTRLIPKFLVTPSLRLYYLRTVIALSAITIWYGVWLYLIAGRPTSVVVAIVITSVTFAHNFGTAIGPTYFPILTIIDLILLIFETICAVYLMVMLIYWKNTFDVSVKWFPKRAVFGLCVFCGLTLALVGLLILKLCDLACSPAGTIFRRANIRHSYTNIEEPEDTSQSPRSWKYVGGALFGRKPWQEKLPGESRWIRSLRGLATLAILIVLAIYGAYESVLKPIAEMGMIPNSEFRAFALPGTFETSETIVYNLIVAWNAQPDAPKTLLDAVTVEMIPRIEDPSLNACSKSQSAVLVDSLPPTYEVVVFQCARPIPGFGKPEYGLHEFLFERDFRRPNLQLRVDFDDLRDGNRSISEGVDLIYDALQIWLGFTEDIADVTNATAPLPLFPGANLLTVSDFAIRQKLKPGSLATLGFDMYSTFIAPSFVYTVPNPFITTTSSSASTLRIVPSLEVGEWVIHQDFRNQSVLNGLSALGGLGSFLSSLLVIVLGSTLMQTVRGKKPYSPFGFFHNTDQEQRTMREKCLERYPDIIHEIEAFSGQSNKGGVVAFLLDTLIDVESLGFKEARDPPGAATGLQGLGGDHERARQSLRESKGEYPIFDPVFSIFLPTQYLVPYDVCISVSLPRFDATLPCELRVRTRRIHVSSRK